MSGHRDDGTYAEDTAHHEGRKIRRRDDAPAGGIPRPKMHGCLDCGTPTPSDNGDTCTDCTDTRDEASSANWAREQRADAVKGMFGYPR